MLYLIVSTILQRRTARALIFGTNRMLNIIITKSYNIMYYICKIRLIALLYYVQPIENRMSLGGVTAYIHVAHWSVVNRAYGHRRYIYII